MIIRVLFIEDDPITRRLLCEQLNRMAGIFFCRAVDCWVNALQLLEAEAANIDLVLLDVGLPGTNGVEAANRIHAIWENLKIVMYTGDERRETIIASLRAGALGYVLKSETQDRLAAKLEKIASGRIDHVDKEIAGHIRDSELIYEALSVREQEIFDRCKAGEPKKQICDELGISNSTLKTHQERIRLKTHAAASIPEAAWRRRQSA